MAFGMEMCGMLATSLMCASAISCCCIWCNSAWFPHAPRSLGRRGHGFCKVHSSEISDLPRVRLHREAHESTQLIRHRGFRQPGTLRPVHRDPQGLLPISGDFNIAMTARPVGQELVVKMVRALELTDHRQLGSVELVSWTGGELDLRNWNPRELLRPVPAMIAEPVHHISRLAGIRGPIGESQDVDPTSIT